MNDSIKKMLRLVDKNLTITEVVYETFQKKNTLIIDAVLSPPPCAEKSNVIPVKTVEATGLLRVISFALDIPLPIMCDTK